MKVIGVVGEYNPFHNGHALHLAESRALLGGDARVVSVMSGNFVQRGEAAIFRKHARAEAAVRCGADLVFELPLPWALSSAEAFARGAAGLLGALGVVTHLSFGSECGDVSKLGAVAEALLDPLVDRQVAETLEKNPELSYAAARQAALAGSLGELSKLLESPNNILGVEYIKAVMDLRLNLEPITTLRLGPGHDRRAGQGQDRSASELRSMLREGADIAGCIPAPAGEVIAREIRQGRGPVTMDALELALLSRLRMLGEEDYAALPDAGEGLHNRLYRAAKNEATLDEVLAAAKTKRYALSRLRRMTMCAALGVRAGMAADTPPYARLLAANDRGRELLRETAPKARVPVITKPAEIKNLNAAAVELFALECAADDLYVLGFPARRERRGGSAWRSSPVVMDH